MMKARVVDQPIFEVNYGMAWQVNEEGKVGRRAI